MAEKFGKMKCKTILFKIKYITLFTLQLVSKTQQQSEHHTAHCQWKHDISKEIVSYKLGNL
jgi:hypothetical protein